VRFQYLDIPLSEAEQASFLAQYGDRIQEVVSTGFQRIERSLNRILFLHEAGDVLQGIHVRFQLKESYPATEVGHFRAFVSLFLHAVKHDILMMLFGSSDKTNRFRDDVRDNRKDQIAGIAHGIGSGQWEKHMKLAQPAGYHEESKPNIESGGTDQEARSYPGYVCVGSGSSIGMDPVPAITIHYAHDNWPFRVQPRLDLRDLDDCMFMPILNKSLADKLHSIEVFANGYKLTHIGFDDFRIDQSHHKNSFPDTFTPEELADPWVRIRPSNGSSSFELEFMSTTPRRMFGHKEIPGLIS
jgi:hypothetical protein